MDTLTIKGQGRRIDGDYPCEILGMLSLGHDEVLNNQEANLVKQISGAIGSEIADGFVRGDAAVRMALAIVVLERAGIRLDVR